MAEVDSDVRPGRETERAGADVLPERVQLVRGGDASPACLSPGDALQLPELLERIDANVRIGADRDGDRTSPHAVRGEKTVAQVGLGGRTGADRRSRRSEKVELGAVRMRRVHDRRPG